jgi:hypothetical protein
MQKLGIAPFTLHDLRRTCRTGLSRLKVAPHVAERVLNHAQEKIAGHVRHARLPRGEARSAREVGGALAESRVNSVIQFPEQLSEFTGLKDEPIDRHPLRAYLQGVVAGALLSSERAAEKDKFWRQQASRSFFAGVEAAWKIAPPKFKQQRGRKKLRLSWGDVRNIYVWIQRRGVVHDAPSLKAATEYLAKRGAGSRSALERKYKLVRKLFAEASGEWAELRDSINAILRLERMQLDLKAVPASQTVDAEQYAWAAEWRSPLPPDPSRRTSTKARTPRVK